MGKPKKKTTPRRTGNRRSHLVVKLARAVNAKSPLKAYTTRRESGKNLTTRPTKTAKYLAISGYTRHSVARKGI